MHNSQSVQEKETHKILWEFEIQTDHLISARWPDQLIVNKKREPAELWTLPFQLTSELLNLARELKKKLWNMKVTVILIVIGALGTVTKGLVLWLKDLEIKKRVETIQTTALLIVEMGQNTEKSSGDSRRLAVIQTQVENNQQKLVWKTLKRVEWWRVENWRTNRNLPNYSIW